MRVHRIVLVATWILVSLLAVVGFANFSASDDAPSPTDSPATTYAPDLGADAGAASAMAFAFMADGRVVSQAQSAPVETTIAQTGPAEPNRPSTTFVRSSILNESAVREIVARVFEPADVSRAIRSAWCASNFDPGYQHGETGAAGLFQLTPEQWSTNAPLAGYSSAEITDPDANAAVAAWIVYQASGSWSNLACSG